MLPSWTAPVALGTVLAVAAAAVAVAKPAPLKLALGDFKIAPRTSTAKAGKLRIAAVNGGHKTHEVLVVRGRAAHLPMKGGRVDEKKLEHSGTLIGELADIGPKRTATKSFDLRPGTYTLLCNLPGHYRAGMRATLVVRGG